MYNAAPGLNSYLDSIERVEQLQIDAEHAFNLLDDDQKVAQLIEWNSLESITDAAGFIFARKLQDLDPDYLEFLEADEDYDSLFILIKKTVGCDEYFASALQEKFDKQIIEKYERGEF